MKYLMFLDTETTGLDPEKNGIFQLAGYIDRFEDINNVENLETFNFRFKLMDGDVYDQGSFKSHGITEAEIATYDSPQDAFYKFNRLATKYLNLKEKYMLNGSKNPKRGQYEFIGHNGRFDYNMVDAWFKKNNNRFWYQTAAGACYSTESIIKSLNILGKIQTENIKLATAGLYFGYEHKAHDAFSDITITRDMFYKYHQAIAHIDFKKILMQNKEVKVIAEDMLTEEEQGIIPF